MEGGRKEERKKKVDKMQSKASTGMQSPPQAGGTGRQMRPLFWVPGQEGQEASVPDSPGGRKC